MLTRFPILIHTLLLTLISPLPALAAPSCGHPVLRVVDGDTIVVRFRDKTEKIRLLNVDTPESVHPDSRRNTSLGRQASAHTRSRLEGKTVCLEFEGRKRGRYGRLLAYVILDGQNVNLELVRQGWSPYYTKYGNSPRFHERFLAAQDQARSEGRHIWEPGRSKATSPSGNALAPKQGLFRGNTGSRVFHSPECRWYRCQQCTRIFSSRDAALTSGYRPCRICRP